jgi:hypothetical protein
MVDAIQRLLLEREQCCGFYSLIVGDGEPELPQGPEPLELTLPDPEGLNESQLVAMRSWRSSLALIWGPPGKSII